jgi:hypothetical protein
VNTGSINVVCSGVPPQVIEYFKKQLEKTTAQKDQALRDLDSMRKQFDSVQENLAKVGIQTYGDREVRRLTSEGKIDEASTLHKQLLAKKDEQAAEQQVELAQEHLIQGQLSEIQQNWPEALVWYQKAHEDYQKHQDLPQHRDAALGYARALQHLGAADMAKASELYESASQISGAFAKKFNAALAQEMKPPAALAELQSVNSTLLAVSIKMSKLFDSQSKVTDPVAYKELTDQSTELQAKLAEIEKQLKKQTDAKEAELRPRFAELDEERPQVDKQTEELEAEAKSLAEQGKDRIREAERLIAGPLAELEQLAKTDLKTYGPDLVLALQEQIVVDVSLKRSQAERTRVLQSFDVQIKFARSDPKTEPIILLSLEAQKDVMASALKDEDADKDSGDNKSAEDDDYVETRLRSFWQDVLKTYTPRALRNPADQVYVAAANLILAGLAVADEQYPDAEKYAREALARFAKVPKTLPSSGPISFGDRPLWIPTATFILAEAEGHRNQPMAAEKDYRKAIADVSLLVKQDTERYALQIAPLLQSFSEFLVGQGREPEAREQFDKVVALYDVARERGQKTNELAQDYLQLFDLAKKAKNLGPNRCALLAKAWDALPDQTAVARTQIILTADSARSDKECAEEDLSEIPSLMIRNPLL